MAGIVDVSTGKIIGVKRGTLAWWHEKGHIAYSKSEKGIKLGFYQQSFIVLTVFFLVIQLFLNPFFFKLLPLVSIVSFLVLYEYEEIWCWRYAYRMRKKKSKT